MTKLLKSPFAFLFLLAVFCAVLPHQAWAKQKFKCDTNGDFNTGGAINTEATITGPNNLTMSPAGAITYAALLNGPSTGTAMSCAGTGLDTGTNYAVSCDATGTITNSGGSQGTSPLNVTQYTISTTGGSSNLTNVTCKGLGTSIGNFQTSSGDITVNIGAVINATNVDIGGTYTSGSVNIEIVESGGSTYLASVLPDFTVVFTSLLGIASTTNIAFGEATFSGTPTSSSDFVKLGTNSAATYGGVFTAGGSTVPAAGTVVINNVQNGTTVQVQCDASAVMTNGASAKITVDGVKVAAEGSTGSYTSAGSACNGNAGAVATTMTYNSSTANTFYFGGMIDGSTATSFAAGAYSSANSGGTPMTVVVLYQ